MNLVALGAMGTTIAAFWSRIKFAINYVVRIVVAEAIVADSAATAIEYYCWRKGKRSPFARKVVKGEETYVSPLKRNIVIAWEQIGGEPVLFIINKRPIVVFIAGDKIRDDEDGHNHDSMLRLVYIRGTFNIKEFINTAIDEYNQKKIGFADSSEKNDNKRFQIYTRSGTNGTQGGGYDGPDTSGPSRVRSSSEEFLEKVMLGAYNLYKWDPNDLIPLPEDKNPFDTFPYPDHVTEAIGEINRWKASEKWFNEKRIPWRRGWLLYGPPGTGKSSLAKSIGQMLDMPINVFDISSMSNTEFTHEWKQMQRLAPCIALIEDIDAVFNLRKNIYSEKAGQGMSYLTFDCLLNCISGVNRTDGVFTIVTTNNVDNLDPALGIPDEDGKSSRPGRLDRMLYLGDMDERCRRVVAERIIGDWPELIDETVKKGDGMVAAQYEDLLCNLAQEKFWEKEKGKK